MPLSKEINPGRVLIIGYFLIITLGGLLLFMPFASKSISLVDAMYTATSAVCVTGLIVRDTATDFTMWGKLIIILLVQVGGIGYMTFSTTFFFFLGRKISLRDKLLFKESLNLLSYKSLMRFAWRVFRITVIVELIGGLSLAVVFMDRFQPVQALGHGLFHAIAAFCNAGFSTFSENLLLYTNTYWAPVIVALIVMLGGIGFVILSDIYYVFVKRERRQISLHSKIVLKTTLFLILIGTAFFFLVEGWRGLSGYPLPLKITNSFFQAVTPRTAGFNTVVIGSLAPITLIAIIVLMFIGASPGSTGGGIKTSTFTLLLWWMKDLFLGRYGNDINIGKKRIPIEQAFRAILIVFSSVVAITLAFLIIILVDDPAPLSLLFEIVSAFGTVGLSVGSKMCPVCSLSYDFSWISKTVIVLLMVGGKVGIITVANALLKPHKLEYTYPEESIVIG